VRSFAGIGAGASDGPDPAKVRQVKEWVRQAFGIGEDQTVMVAEVTCTEPGCPPIETVIAILDASGRAEHRLHLAVADLAPMHLWQLAAGDHGCCR